MLEHFSIRVAAQNIELQVEVCALARPFRAAARNVGLQHEILCARAEIQLSTPLVIIILGLLVVRELQSKLYKRVRAHVVRLGELPSELLKPQHVEVKVLD